LEEEGKPVVPRDSGKGLADRVSKRDYLRGQARRGWFGFGVGPDGGRGRDVHGAGGGCRA
jgi:hypothetical protein